MDKCTFDKASFDALLRRRMFYVEASEIDRKASGFIGDNRGLDDLGPPGCALQANIIALCRKHFVLEEDMLELVRKEIGAKGQSNVAHLHRWTARC